jgi:arabinofuranosyltransferase
MKRWFAFAALALVFIANALWFYQALGWDAVDDAYISYVYARNVILGHGLTFNPSERVEGYTNFLWTALMTPIVGLNLDVGRISSALGVAFGIGVLVLTIRFAKRLGIPEIVGWIAALFLAADGSFALWSVSGLETSMFAFLSALGVFLYIGENTSPFEEPSRRIVEQHPGRGSSPLILKGAGRLPLSGIVFAIAAMTRPEAGAVFTLLVAHQLAWRVVDQRKLFTQSDWVRAFSFAALFVPYWLLRWRYYHAFLPNSFYAKVSVGGPIAQILRGWEYVQQFVGVHLSWLIVLPALIALGVVSVRYFRARGDGRERTPFRSDARGERNAAASVPYENARGERNAAASVPYENARAFFGFTFFAAVMLFYGAYIVYVGGDWSVGRFFVPMLAFVYLMIAAGIYFIVEFVLQSVSRFTFGASRRAQGAILLAIPIALALWFASAYNGEYKIFIGGFDAALATQARITAGKWLRQNVPAGTWIAVDAAGQVPYFSELPAIDMFGINDVHIGRMPVANLGSGTPGHEKFDLGYIIARAPKYVVIYGTLFDSVPEYQRANVSWTSDPALEKFLTIYERADGK